MGNYCVKTHVKFILVIPLTLGTKKTRDVEKMCLELEGGLNKFGVVPHCLAFYCFIKHFHLCERTLARTFTIAPTDTLL